MNDGSISMMLFLMIAATYTVTDDCSSFKVTTKRDNDRVDMKTEENRATISIHSPVGISRAVFERTGEKWPEVVVLRLHLKGLESFKVANNRVKLGASVSSQDGSARLWKDGNEDLPLDSKSPYWMQIHLVGKEGKPVKAIPLEDGYFELQLPKVLFEDNPKSITADWIDFHR